MDVRDFLIGLRQTIAEQRFSRVSRGWTGAGVAIITPSEPLPGPDGLRLAPRLVVTPFALELSWLVERLGRGFFEAGRIDGNSKIEFFGRLANAANRLLQSAPGSSCGELCDAILLEAHVILLEMDRGTFRTLCVAPTGHIADDDVPDGTTH